MENSVKKRLFKMKIITKEEREYYKDMFEIIRKEGYQEGYKEGYSKGQSDKIDEVNEFYEDNY